MKVAIVLKVALEVLTDWLRLTGKPPLAVSDYFHGCLLGLIEMLCCGDSELTNRWLHILMLTSQALPKIKKKFSHTLKTYNKKLYSGKWSTFINSMSLNSLIIYQ